MKRSINPAASPKAPSSALPPTPDCARVRSARYRSDGWRCSGERGAPDGAPLRTRRPPPALAMLGVPHGARLVRVRARVGTPPSPPSGDQRRDHEMPRTTLRPRSARQNAHTRARGCAARDQHRTAPRCGCDSISRLTSAGSGQRVAEIAVSRSPTRCRWEPARGSDRPR